MVQVDEATRSGVQMKCAIGCVAILLMAMNLTGCCQNKALRSGLQAYSNVIGHTGKWVIDNDLINPKAVGTSPDGTFNKAKCIEAAKMLDLFAQGFPLMSSSLGQWAQGEDVLVPPRVKVDYEAFCL